MKNTFGQYFKWNYSHISKSAPEQILNSQIYYSDPQKLPANSRHNLKHNAENV